LRSRRVLRQDSGSIDRCERKAAGCADQHLAPGHSIAMLLRHFNPPIRPRKKWPGHDGVMKRMGHSDGEL
jgi:hypothetical protein